MNGIWCICNLSLPFSFFFYRSGHKNTIQFRTLSGGSKLQSMERCYEDGGSSSRRSSYRVPQKSMHHLLIMVFCYQNCSDLLWEKIVLVIDKNFWNSRLKAENFKIFEITWTIYSNRQYLVTECFFSLFLEVSQIKKK